MLIKSPKIVLKANPTSIMPAKVLPITNRYITAKTTCMVAQLLTIIRFLKHIPTSSAIHSKSTIKTIGSVKVKMQATISNNMVTTQAVIVIFWSFLKYNCKKYKANNNIISLTTKIIAEYFSRHKKCMEKQKSAPIKQSVKKASFFEALMWYIKEQTQHIKFAIK